GGLPSRLANFIPHRRLVHAAYNVRRLISRDQAPAISLPHGLWTPSPRVRRGRQTHVHILPQSTAGTQAGSRRSRNDRHATGWKGTRRMGSRARARRKGALAVSTEDRDILEA